MDWRDGQARTAWLNNALQRYVGDPVDYFLGPTGIPQRINALTQAAQYTDAGDFAEATDASRAIWNDPSLGNALRYATAAGAVAVPMVSARMMQDGVDVAGDAARSMYDDASRFWRDEDGAFRVWHGSPHDFDKFDSSRIGTGEGAQAYGHGLYFAEAGDVAREYRDALSGPRGRFAAMPKFKALGGKEPEFIPDGWAQDIADYGESAIRRRVDAIDRDIARLQQQAADEPEMAELIDTIIFPYNREKAELATLLRDGVANDRPLHGQLYEVAIDAEPADFLDWDSPLAAQPRHIQSAIRSANPAAPGMARGHELYEAIAKTRTPRETGKVRLGAAETSELLREAGVPGIRYRDGFSRGTEGGTSNYVLFDDALATILSKNGAPVDTPEARRMRELLDYLNQ